MFGEQNSSHAWHIEVLYSVEYSGSIESCMPSFMGIIYAPLVLCFGFLVVALYAR